MTKFPTDPDGRRAAHQQMKALAPELLDQAAQLREAFPGARMTHFKAGGVEFGEPSKPGWAVDDNLMHLARTRAKKAKKK